MQYQINVEQLDESGEVTDGFALVMRVSPDALARVLPGLMAESMGAERVAVTTVMPNNVPAIAGEQPADDKPKRTRRTKAQIEADKLAQQNGGAMPEPAAEPVSAPQPVGTVPPQAEPAPTAAAAASVPYDPFAAKA